MERPILRCLVAFAVEPNPDWYTDAAVVSLELAAELKERGWMVLLDPQDERDLAMYERFERATKTTPKKKWFEVP